MTDREEMRSKAEELLARAGVPADGTAEAGMQALHELYLSLQSGGFSRWEALWIIGYMFSNGAGIPLGEPENKGDHDKDPDE